MKNPVGLDNRIKMLKGKAAEVLARRLNGFECEVVKYGRDEGTVERGETAEICVTAVIGIRIAKKPKRAKKIDE